MASKSNGSSSKAGAETPVSSASPTAGTKRSLASQYPVNSAWEFTLSNDETVSGRVYCTDEISQIVVLQKALVHTTLSSEVRMVHAASIVQSKEMTDAGGTEVAPLSQPLPKIQKKALEERERKAIRLAEESFQQINQKASPEGQAVFDRLLKACGVAHWQDESIVVLHQIQVDPPYGADHCRILQRKGSNASLDDSSLERVKKIVGVAASSPSSNPPTTSNSPAP